ncbi:MAG TPA: helix-turn-helix transcriptional regulator [Bacteroidales bacterium]|nr:helix-turn-helix transcriptional regulator [Bacteroidales bacterium]
MNPNEMLLREMKARHLTKKEVARKLGVNPSSVKGMIRRPTMHVQRLMELSEVLQYNFFREIAATLPYKEPSYEPEIDTVKAPLLEQIKNLQLEISILRQTLKDLTSGGR